MLNLFIIAGIIEELKTAYVEMPYSGEHGSISMFILLPIFTANAIDELLKHITTDQLERVFSEKSYQEVDIEFPKISFERKFQFVPVNSSYQ